MCSGLDGRDRIGIGRHIRGYLYDIDDRRVCPRRTVQIISSAAYKRRYKQIASHLDFQLATPPTAFAWASTVRHYGQLAGSRQLPH